MVETPEGAQPVEMRGDFTVGQPEGVPEGSPVDVPMAVNLGPLPSSPPPVHLAVRDRRRVPAGASVSFATRPAGGAPADA